MHGPETGIIPLLDEIAFAGRLCCRVFVLGWLGHDSPHLKPQCFILFVQLLSLLSPSGPSLRARSATTEGKKMGGCRFGGGVEAQA